MKLYLGDQESLSVKVSGDMVGSGYRNVAEHLIRTDKEVRNVGFVEYVPQVVKVENVYNYGASVEKSKRTELHLRVLIKTLLEEL